ncbi:MAG: DmsE family decaheme c-type cytochrome [Vicinamibacteria bacterium]
MGIRSWTVPAVVGLALSLGLASAGSAQTSAAPAAAAQPAATAEYAGMDTCVQCHEDQVKAFKTTPHMASALGCEGCHGPGKAHAEAGGDKAKIKVFATLSARASSETCMECHNKAGQKHWMGSSHDSRQIACTACHSVHPKPGAAVEKAMLKQPQMKLCTSCHLQKKAQLIRPGHMPMRESKMQCTSCHNPHGTPNDKMLLQTSVNQNCYSCHAEKRGPFLWEHAPVRENCLNCHDAHGSINEKMLKVKQPLLCQQCHQTSSHPGPAYPAQSRYAFNQGCMHCHPTIHGSVHPSGNRFFR